MAQSSEVSTTKAQRFLLWTVAILMLVGTIGSFAMIVIANSNNKSDRARYQDLMSQYQKEYADYQTKVSEQATELSEKYFSIFSPYATRVGVFDKGSVEDLKTEDIVIGDGEDLTSDSSFTAYYIGWNPDGKIFDQSIDGNSLKAPYTATPGMVIDGWTKGVDGMKVGGIRELTIPSDLAYGASGQGADIQPNTPLKFVIMTIEKPEEIAPPEMSDELYDLYSKIQSGSI